MASSLDRFERLARSAQNISDVQPVSSQAHPFETRNIHELISRLCLSLFDDGYFAQATFEALKYLDKVVQALSGSPESGFKLMMTAFSESSPAIQLTPLSTATERDEQKGFQFLFAGSVLAIRNPRGHQVRIKDDPDTCLDHLSVASFLLRRIEATGKTLPAVG